MSYAASSNSVRGADVAPKRRGWPGLSPYARSSRRHRRHKGLAGAGAVALLALMGACAMPEQSYPYERPTPGELADQLAKCAKGIEDWKKTSGRVDYPGTLTVQTGHSTTYNAAIDISDTPQPPESVIVVPTGEPTARSITVKCAVAAHLVPTEGDVTVNPSPTPGSPVSSTPPVSSHGSGRSQRPRTTDARVMLEIQPAHLDNGVPLTAGTQVAQVFTQVQVTSTWNRPPE